MAIWISVAALLVSGGGLWYTHVQTRDSRATRKDVERAQRSALIRAHLVQDGKKTQLVVGNAGQADCVNAAVTLGVSDGRVISIGSGLHVPSGGWIALPFPTSPGVGALTDRLEVSWTDKEGSPTKVQTLGSALSFNVVAAVSSFWDQVKHSGI